MPDRLLRAHVKLKAANGLNEDACVNVFHFIADENGNSLANMAAEIATALESFYADVHAPGAVALETRMSSLMAVTGHELRVYRMLDPEPRTPLLNTTFNLDGVGGSTLPREVALCMSYQATPTSGLDQRNRRGRIYLGPFDTGAQDSATGRPSTQLRDAVRGAGIYLRDYAWTVTNGKWVVYSPTLGTWAPVTSGWVDDAFDTQRRRGSAITAKTTW